MCTLAVSLEAGGASLVVEVATAVAEVAADCTDGATDFTALAVGNFEFFPGGKGTC